MERHKITQVNIIARLKHGSLYFCMVLSAVLQSGCGGGAGEIIGAVGGVAITREYYKNNSDYYNKICQNSY